MDQPRNAQPTWANVECEGEACSVGPFVDRADADHFRAAMFAGQHGTSDPVATGRELSVAGFQDRFRADFVHGGVPPHWGARG